MPGSEAAETRRVLWVSSLRHFQPHISPALPPAVMQKATLFLHTSAAAREINNAPRTAGHVYNDHFAIMTAHNDRRGTTRGGTNLRFMQFITTKLLDGTDAGGAAHRWRLRALGALGGHILVTCAAQNYYYVLLPWILFFSTSHPCLHVPSPSSECFLSFCTSWLALQPPFISLFAIY